ncbi:ABC transporter permease [Amycolatopsis sp.]|uniref:ABC transporter permease n=1 Tax=Amycolatopsis sp. TaxID=37632 RepID=UPI002BD1D329|nr:ABC transporter permease [Amycolatopsis sp.]HVV08393.1 ABC transporter permease [Amycolatopsis sp.]
MQNLTFLVLGLGNGAILAAFGLSLAVFYRSSGVVNFGTGAIGMYGAYTFNGLRTSGDLFNPIFGLPPEVHLGGPMPVWAALLITLAISVVLGLLCYVLIFRPLRHARAVAKAVASVGILLVLEGVVSLRLGTNPVGVTALFPSGTLQFGDLTIPTDRLWAAGLALILLAVAVTIYNFTRFGKVTKAVVESEKGSVIVGVSPERVALANWGLGSGIAGVAGALVSPLVSLTPSGFTLLVVPALAVALLGRFSSLVVITISGLVLGMLQSDLSLQSTNAWYPTWLGNGVQDLLPLVAVLIVLIVRGTSLPARGLLLVQDLPVTRRPRHVGWSAAIPFVLGLVALFALQGSYRAALTTSLVLAILALSFVVVTGYVGQISFAQYSLAGLSALLLARMTTDWGIPFPFAPILSALAAGVVGTLVGLPALRVRGVNLAVVTIATAIAIQSVYFENNALNGGTSGAKVTGPSLFGLDLRIGSGDGYPRIQFGILCLVVLTLTGIGVANLRRSRLGAQMLAVRADERSAAANGINVARVKLLGFAVGSCIAGLGGAMLGYQQTAISGDSFDVLTSIMLFGVCYIAGITTVAGAVVAGIVGSNGLVFVITDRLISFGDYYLLVTGLMLIFAVIRHPEGIGGAAQEPLKRLARAVFRRRAPETREPAGSELVATEPEQVGR